MVVIILLSCALEDWTLGCDQLRFSPELIFVSLTTLIRSFLFFKQTHSGISHSVISDMQIIEQETPTTAKPRKKYEEEDLYFSSPSSR